MTRVLTHPPDTPYPELSEDAQKVVDWRLEWLLRDGCFQRRNAEKIAFDTTIDYRFAIDLHKRSGNEKLTMRILFGK